MQPVDLQKVHVDPSVLPDRTQLQRQDLNERHVRKTARHVPERLLRSLPYIIQAIRMDVFFLEENSGEETVSKRISVVSKAIQEQGPRVFPKNPAPAILSQIVSCTSPCIRRHRRDHCQSSARITGFVHRGENKHAQPLPFLVNLWATNDQHRSLRFIPAATTPNLVSYPNQAE